MPRYKVGIYRAPYKPGYHCLEGIPGRGISRNYWQSMGWEYVRGIGRPGLYRTTDTEVVRKTAMLLGIEILDYPDAPKAEGK